MMFAQMIQDALFAAIAAIGFAAISNPPRKAYLWCALIAAIAHSLRFLLINAFEWHIVVATTVVSLLIGIIAVIISPGTKIPAETYLYPSLLPMIPGIYAYKTFGALAMCLYVGAEGDFMHYFYLFVSNGFTCFFILMGMVIGAASPIFFLQRISFRATRPDEPES